MDGVYTRAQAKINTLRAGGGAKALRRALYDIHVRFIRA
jgi:hypothetical protein